MKYTRHLKNCKELQAYKVALIVKSHLKDWAKINKVDHKTIKVLSKKEVIHNHTGPADAQIYWSDCPEGYLETQLMLIDRLCNDVCVTMVDEKTLSFFDT